MVSNSIFSLQVSNGILGRELWGNDASQASLLAQHHFWKEQEPVM